MIVWNVFTTFLEELVHIIHKRLNRDGIETFTSDVGMILGRKARHVKNAIIHLILELCNVLVASKGLVLKVALRNNMLNHVATGDVKLHHCIYSSWHTYPRTLVVRF